MTSGPRSKTPQAGRWILFALIVFLSSRVAIEIARVNKATSEDADFALQLGWASSLTLVATLAAGVAFIRLTQRSAATRHQHLVARGDAEWIFETLRAPAVRTALRDAGAPASIIGTTENSYFSVVANGKGLSLWVGSTQPTCEWLVEWSSVRSITSTSVVWLWRSLPAIQVTMSADGSTRTFLLPLSEIGWLQPRPLTSENFDKAMSTLRSIWAKSSSQPAPS